MTLVPVGPIDSYYSYALDIRSRIEFLPTFAKLLRDPKIPVDIAGDPVRGLLDFTVKADTPVQARDELQRAAAYADNVLHESIGYQEYSLQSIGSMQIVAARRYSPSAPFVAAGIGLGAAVLGGLVLSRRNARGRTARLVAATPLPQGAL